jgi:hypothetical protein
VKIFQRAFWVNLFKRPARVFPILNAEGCIICSQQANGTFTSNQVVVGARGNGPWYVGRPISLEVRGGQLWVSGVHIFGRSTGDFAEEILLYEGDKASAQALLSSVQQAWMEANTGDAKERVTKRTGAAGAPAWRAPAMNPWRKLAVLSVGSLAVFCSGLGAMHLYLHPSGPGVNLSGMSVDEVARLDSNPAAIREVQEQMMAAIELGRSDAKKLQGRIEKDHMDTLKAMGLDVGVSGKNAMNCLAGK